MNPSYVLGHSDREMERLKNQARLLEPITRRYLVEAGLAENMRVLDVGSGAGDVAFLAAELVGEAGEVVGVDRAATAIATARARAAERGLQRITFTEGDPAETDLGPPFDAVIGRYVLQFQPEPGPFLRKVTGRVRPGGVVMFHEIDWGGVESFPPTPTYDRCRQWAMETIRRGGGDVRMGMKLHATFIAAELPKPLMRIEALMDGAPGSAMARKLADLVATVLPEMEKLGIATAAEVDLDTLVERMEREALASNSVFVTHHDVGAWTRIPHADQ